MDLFCYDAFVCSVQDEPLLHVRDFHCPLEKMYLWTKNHFQRSRFLFLPECCPCVSDFFLCAVCFRCYKSRILDCQGEQNVCSMMLLVRFGIAVHQVSVLFSPSDTHLVDQDTTAKDQNPWLEAEGSGRGTFSKFRSSSSAASGTSSSIDPGLPTKKQRTS